MLLHVYTTCNHAFTKKTHKDFASKKISSIFAHELSGCGEIGRRARLRI